ncbi:MAG: hypothetical protein IJ062_11630 [Firmicutes bacterium]|nr:hypothetical protein [Bacillota bacterium]
MFKKFVNLIIAAGSKEKAYNDVFYGENGIDMAFQKEKISYKDYETLVKLINILR